LIPEQVTKRLLRIEPDQVAAVTPVKNEITLLPHFLKHYRRLGVSHFLMIDNGSTDGSFDYLLQQTDCTVFRALDSYREANYGMEWVSALQVEHCRNRWSLFVDCDELLIYPDCERVSIEDYCAKLRSKGFDSVFACMIDTYPEGDFLSTKISPDADLIDQMGWFDTDYVFRPWPRRPWDPPVERFRLQVLGGPRCRLLSSLDTERRRGAFHYTLINQVDRIIDHVPASAIRYLASVCPAEMPAQQKQPLNFVTEGFRFFNGHGNTNKAYADDLVGLLHFKLCDELQKRLAEKSIMENHYRRGLPYEQLRQSVMRWGRRPLTYEGSRRFRTSSDLESVGLIGPRAAALWAKGSTIKEFVTAPTDDVATRTNTAEPGRLSSPA
jgi:glycosyltransferase involved in cell wall biosynthesis